MQQNSVLIGCLGAMALTLLVSASPTAAGEDLSFIAVGDLPYPDQDDPERQQRRFSDEIVPAIRVALTPFVIHFGDFKGGGESCSDELIAKRHGEIMGLHAGPVFYTPGDNDWTDCDRGRLARPMSELERLDHLRRVFFARPLDLPVDWHHARQPLYPENARWRRDGVVFTTLHIVGTNNGRDKIKQDIEKFAIKRVEARDRANQAWLEAAFTTAQAVNADALVVAIHSDITDVDDPEPCSKDKPSKCDGYAGFRTQLATLAAGFGRPVLLLHGSTGPYCLEQAFAGTANLWRLNAAGDTAVVDATLVTVRTGGETPAFKARTLLGGKAPGAC